MEFSPRLFGLFLLSTTAMAQLPVAYTPPANPPTPAKVLLGKMLFWDEQLSSDDTVACGTCHLPEAGGADPRTAAAPTPGHDGVFGTEDDGFGSPGVVAQDAQGDYQPAGAFGVRRQVTGRIAPSNIGSLYHADLFWDGRARSTFVDPETGAVVLPVGGALESQALGPILSPVEMGSTSRTWADVRSKLARVQPLALASELPTDLATALTSGHDYPTLFAAAFGDAAITPVRIAFALASYQRTLMADQTPFDSYTAGDTSALTAKQVQGMNLFFGAANCFLCHTAPLFTDDRFHNLGLRPASEDLGRGGESGVSIEDGAFKTPSLRNVGLRPRLFHNGQSPALNTLAQISDVRSVANVYLRGGGADRSNLDPFLSPLVPNGVNLQDLTHVLDFVANGLTDPRAANGLPPFDHPKLRTQTVPGPLEFGPSLGGNHVPGFVATAPTYVGNRDWKLGLHGGDGNTTAFLVYSATARMPAAIFGGVPVNIGADSDYVPFQLHGPAGSPGLTTWHLAIPKDPAITGLRGYFQLFTVDPTAPLGIGASQGLELIVR